MFILDVLSKKFYTFHNTYKSTSNTKLKSGSIVDFWFGNLAHLIYASVEDFQTTVWSSISIIPLIQGHCATLRLVLITRAGIISHRQGRL